jgi:hypothetical protein
VSDTNEFDRFCTPSKPLGDPLLMVVEIKRLERENAELSDFVERHEDALRLLRIWAAKPMHGTNCDDLREETIAYLKTQ